MARLSKTRAQLATSVSIRAFVSDLEPGAVLSAEEVRALASGETIGAIESFSEATPRSTEPRYELDADTAGDLVERIPQLVDRSLTVNRAVLYTSDMLAAFGFSDIEDIADQNLPFVVVKVERAPEGSPAPTRTTVYTGCWFHDLPKSYDIGGNLKVMQDVTIGYTRKFSA